MAGLPLILVDATTNAVYGLPFARLEPPELPARVSVKETLAPRRILYRQVDPETGRALGQPSWTLTWPALRDRSCAGRNTRSLASLLLWMWDEGHPVYLTGAPLLALSEQPLRRVTSGAVANRRFVGALPWWHTDVQVYCDGVLQSSGVTFERNHGYVTFDAAVDSGVVVTATGSRRPKCVVTSLPVTPVNGVYPVQYQCQAVFMELEP